MPKPTMIDNISELSSILKPRYPRQKPDQLGIKFKKGHRTAVILSGRRPITRSPKRPA